MSFSVALQSAVFYFMACTPCAKVRHRQKARQKAKREREEKARMEADMPHLYRHPSPFTTNPYWSEEIMMGPSLPKKNAGSKNASQRRLTSAGRESSAAGSSVAISSTVGGTTHVEESSSPTVAPADSGARETVLESGAAGSLSITLSGSTGDDWNRKRYQREDEELWGHEQLSRTGHKLMDAIKQAGSSAGRFVEAKLVGKERERPPPASEDDRNNFYGGYFSPRNPPVNDYHPPVVSSKPARRDAHRWMLQPPPPAKVMEGKIPVSRSASQISVATRRSAAADGQGMPGLGRLVGERLVEARIRKGGGSGGGPPDEYFLSTSSLTRPRSRRTATGSTTGTRSHRSARSRSLSLSTDSEGESEGVGVGQRRKRRTRVQPATPTVDSEDEELDWPARKPDPLPNAATPGHVAQRPRLETIMSSDATGEPAGASLNREMARSREGEVAGVEVAGRLENITHSPSLTRADGSEASTVKGRPTGSSIDSGMALQP